MSEERTRNLPATIHQEQSLVVAEVYDRVSALTTEHLREELAAGLRLTAANLVRLAVVIRTLEERGEDLSELRGMGMLTYLRQIAHGQVLPEVVVRFSGYPLLLDRVKALPLPDQRRLAAGEPVPLYFRADEGAADHRMVDPLKLGRAHVLQVFAADHVRDEAEQLILVDTRPRAGRPEAPPRGKVRADRARGGLKVGRVFVPHAEVVLALADLAPGEPRQDVDGADWPTVPVKLHPEDHRRLKLRAAEAGTTMSDLVRRALRAHGLLSE